MFGSAGLLAESNHGEAKSEAGSQETRLSSVIQPLIKSSCSARGKRPHCDGPGSLLASAIDAFPVLLQHLNHPLHAIARQICSLMLQGGMPTDNCGTFKALKAVWSKLQSFTLHDPRLTNTTIIVVQRALSANLHWSVRILTKMKQHGVVPLANFSTAVQNTVLNTAFCCCCVEFQNMHRKM